MCVFLSVSPVSWFIEETAGAELHQVYDILIHETQQAEAGIEVIFINDRCCVVCICVLHYLTSALVAITCGITALMAIRRTQKPVLYEWDNCSVGWVAIYLAHVV